jgi:hypothetical protein
VAIGETGRHAAGLLSPETVAFTIVSDSGETGEIFDADILLNEADFVFIDIANTSVCRIQQMSTFDLQDVLTHEIGHFIGFDHSPERTSIMFPTSRPCVRRALSPDDALGLCTIYQAGEPVHTCFPPPRGYDHWTTIDPRPFRGQCERAMSSTDSVDRADAGSDARAGMSRMPDLSHTGCRCAFAGFNGRGQGTCLWALGLLLFPVVARLRKSSQLDKSGRRALKPREPRSMKSLPRIRSKRSLRR